MVPPERENPSEPTPSSSARETADKMFREHLLTRDQAEEALEFAERQDCMFAESLVTLGFLSHKQLFAFFARQGVASIPLANYQIPQHVLELIPPDFAKRYHVFPVDCMKDRLTLGMAYPLELEVIRRIEEMTGLRAKPMLCAQVDIENAIEQYYGVEVSQNLVPTLKMSDLFGDVPASELPPVEEVEKTGTALRLRTMALLMREVNGLRGLPQTVLDVQRAMQEVTVSVEGIAEILRVDPVMSARVLSIANSAAYGCEQKIEDIQLAVSLLGLREVYSIVLSAAATRREREVKGMNYRIFWLHSTYAAIAARVLSEAVEEQNAAGAFTAGLLHDVGRYALSQVAPVLYRNIPFALYGKVLVQKEEEVLGVGHWEAGAELCESWNYPDWISEAIRFHHHPGMARMEQKRVALVALADRLSHTTEANMVEKPQTVFAEEQMLLEILEMKDEDAHELMAAFLEQRRDVEPLVLD